MLRIRGLKSLGIVAGLAVLSGLIWCSFYYCNENKAVPSQWHPPTSPSLANMEDATESNLVIADVRLGIEARFEQCPISFWLALLVSGNDSDRLQAAAAAPFLWLGAPARGKITIWDVGESDWDDHVRAMSLRGELTAKAAMMIPYLLLALDDPLDEVRGSAAHMLERIGPEAVWASGRLMVVARTDPKSLVRLRAARALWRTSGETSVSLGVFVDLLKDPDSDQRRLAVLSIRDLGQAGRAALPELERMLSREEGEMRKLLVDAVEWLRR